jgi:gas vesicle protein
VNSFLAVKRTTRERKVGMANQENDRFLCGLLMGGILGAATALLFAPKSGRELRSDLREMGGDAFEGAKKIYADSEEKARAIVGDAQRRAEELTRDAERYLAEARAKAKRILSGSEEK